MNKTITANIEKRKQNIAQRVQRKNWDSQLYPMMKANNILYEVDGRNKGISAGGIGMIHTLVNQIDLPNQINENLNLLKRHLPYYESDHTLKIISHSRIYNGSFII